METVGAVLRGDGQPGQAGRLGRRSVRGGVTAPPGPAKGDRRARVFFVQIAGQEGFVIFYGECMSYRPDILTRTYRESRRKPRFGEEAAQPFGIRVLSL